jgi:hypothetical protein
LFVQFRGVEPLLRELKSKTAQYNAIKINIKLQVKGFGWDWCQQTWSQGGWEFTVEELATHLE